MSPIPAKHRLQGILYMLVSMFFFSAMNNIIRLASHDLPTQQLVFLRNFFSVLILLPWLISSGIGVLKTNRLSGHFWRSAIGIISMEMWFYCLANMNLAQATALNFTSALFVIVIAVTFLKEKATLPQIVGVLLGFIGTIIILKPGTSGWNVMALMVLASSAIMAVASVLVKTLTSTEKATVIVFYMACFMSPLSFPLAYTHWQPVSAYTLSLAFLIALTSTIAHTCLTRAYLHTPLTVLMPMDFLRLLFTASMAYFLFDQTISVSTLIGALFIICGVVIGTGLKDRIILRRVKQVEQQDIQE